MGLAREETSDMNGMDTATATLPTPAPRKGRGSNRHLPAVRSQTERNALAEANLRLVRAAVYQYLSYRAGVLGDHRDYDVDDLASEAILPFLRACELWQPGKGQLSTYV